MNDEDEISKHMTLFRAAGRITFIVLGMAFILIGILELKAAEFFLGLACFLNGLF